mgnify:CR=1 FL=1
MIEDNTYIPPKPGIFTRFLWFCAGADAQLLCRCPKYDQVKYQGLGGVVLATGLLAFLSGSYAFYTIFSPKNDTALNTMLDNPTLIQACVFGLFWSLMICNLISFFCSSVNLNTLSYTHSVDAILESIID